MADHGVTSPLLPPQHSDQILLTLSDDDDSASEPLLSSTQFRTTVDPFGNKTPKIDGVYEWLKIVVCLPIALVRFVLLGQCLVVWYIATKLTLEGWKHRQNPMPRWICRLMWVTRMSARCILISFEKLLGEGLESCSIEELQEIEQKLEKSLIRIRERKNQVFKEQIEQLQEKEKALTAENARLAEKIQKADAKEQKANAVCAESSPSSNVETEVFIGHQKQVSSKLSSWV